jgi:hypothetical protein
MSSFFFKFFDLLPFYVPVWKALASDEVVLHLGHSKLQALSVKGKMLCMGTVLQEFDTFKQSLKVRQKNVCKALYNATDTLEGRTLFSVSLYNRTCSLQQVLTIPVKFRSCFSFCLYL